MIATEAAAVEALRSRGRFGIRLGLARTRALLRALGSPERGLRGALIGGTNGKGSTQAMVASMLSAAGQRVGQTPKPHLVSYRERIVIDGDPISADDFADLVAEVLTAADTVSRRHGPPTEFEALTCAALLWFARAGIAICVVEVGMGGRLDATNAWDGGVAAITNVSLDHMEYLGDTVSAIAREKAAIIKSGDLAITGAEGAALQVIRHRASRLRVPLRTMSPLEVLGMDRLGMRVSHPSLGELRLGLLGRHQATNAAVALGVMEALHEAGIADADTNALRAGLATTRWPGRMEILTLGPSFAHRAVPAGPTLTVDHVDVVLDGAHNAAGAAALADTLDELRPHLTAGRATILLGILRDKEVVPMVQALRSSALLGGARALTTDVPDTPRAMAASDLAALWGSDARPVGHVDAALDEALDVARSLGGPLVVCGSLYLVGHVRGRLVGDPRAVTVGSAVPMTVRGRAFDWGRRTYVMGIINVTPDSFSGDGLVDVSVDGRVDVDAAVRQALRMDTEGADILDIGGESTRPGHAVVSLDEELVRVVPALRAIRASLPDMPLSVDSRKAEVAAAALDAGADVLNDVSGVTGDGSIAGLAGSRGVPYVLMHDRRLAGDDPASVVERVISDVRVAIDRAVALGCPLTSIIVDPGIGFGKSPDQNLELLRDLAQMQALGRPLLLGTSRKSTIGRVLDLPFDDRLEGTLATTALGIAGGVDIVRVHDVRANVRVARMSDAVVRGWRPADEETPA